jgi:hypothetical protein
VLEDQLAYLNPFFPDAIIIWQGFYGWTKLCIPCPAIPFLKRARDKQGWVWRNGANMALFLEDILEFFLWKTFASLGEDKPKVE